MNEINENVIEDLEDMVNDNHKSEHLDKEKKENFSVLTEIKDEILSYVDEQLDKDNKRKQVLSKIGDVFSPADDYPKYLEEYRANLDEYFDQITEKSGIDIKENTKTIENLNAAKDQKKANLKKIKWQQIGRGFTSFFAVAFFILAAISIYQLVKEKLLFKVISYGGGIALTIAFILIAIGFIILIALLINKNIKKYKLDVESDNSVINKTIELAKSQITPLFNLIKNNVASQLVNKTLPFISINKTISAALINYLQDDFDLRLYSKDLNYTSVLSGVVMNNPFLLLNYEYFKMGTKQYSGSITIHWTQHIGDKTYSRSQVLTAVVTKPYPYYFNDGEFIYTSDSAPKLSFSRKPSGYSNVALNPKGLASYLKSGVKEIEKYEKMAVKENHPFTPLTNKEFEYVWGAYDRDDENEFRILFTPLAQKQLLALFTPTVNDGVLFDDYYFTKDKKLNYIKCSANSITDELESLDGYYDINYKVIKEKFYLYCDLYFKSIYHLLAPVLAIPEFQLSENFDQKLYPKTKEKFPMAIHEVAAFWFADKNNLLKDEKYHKADLIAHTKYQNSNQDFDYIKVKYDSFKATKMVDYITKLGGDGLMHSIPVEWLKFDPINTELELAITFLDDMSALEVEQLYTKCFELNFKYKPVIFGNYIVFEYNDIINNENIDWNKFLNRKEENND